MSSYSSSRRPWSAGIAGFRRYWTWISRRGQLGRPVLDTEVRALIRRLATDNLTWLGRAAHPRRARMLGFEISESTVSRYLRRQLPLPHAVKRWLTFLRNHREAIAAMDFFVAPTVTFRVLYVWFVIEHGRRRVLRFEVTEHPAAAWVILQVREACPFDTAPRHLIFDRDSTFSAQVVSTVKSFGTKPTRTSPRSPWQNGIAERCVGTVRRELLNHVVVFNERHLRRLPHDYVAYCHDDRTHLGLGKATPARRQVTRRPDVQAEVVALPRVGGLHHRYE